MIAHFASATAVEEEQAPFTPYSPADLSIEMDEDTRNELAVLMLNELPELIRNRQVQLSRFQLRAEKMRQTAYFTAARFVKPSFAVDVQEDIAADPSYSEAVLLQIAEKILELTVDFDYFADSTIDETETPSKVAADSALDILLKAQDLIQHYAKYTMVNLSWTHITKQDLDFMIATYNKLCLMSPLPPAHTEEMEEQNNNKRQRVDEGEEKEWDLIMNLSVEIDDFFDRQHSEATPEHQERLDESMEDAVYPDDVSHADMEEENLMISLLS